MTKKPRFSAVIGAGVAVFLATSLTGLNARQGGAAAVAIDNDDIGGVVTSTKGPEAGVWVIAQTKDLPTKYIKIVVTDDRGRYVLPDLPKANYDIWVRGYGLVDSPKVNATPGKVVNLRAVIAPSAKAAAEYYPANYWYALLQPPPASDFPGKGLRGPGSNGIPEALKNQGAWIGNIKETNACTQCHQMGTKVTREISPALGNFKTSLEAWDYRVQMGISGSFMNSTMAPLGRERALRVFADWTDRVAKGEVPPVAPARPSGVERNVVVTEWEWNSPELFVHDEISTNRHKPTTNGNGPVYGVTELSGDYLTVLDPVKNTDRKIPIPPNTPPNAPYSWVQEVPVPSPYWGDEVIWKGHIAPHNPWMDSKGRVWITARNGCRMYDPKTEKLTQVTECTGGHHVQMDKDEVLWFDGGGSNSFDIKAWDAGKGKDAMKRWPVVIDTNGNGKLDEGYVDAKSPVDPAKDKAMNYGQSYTSVPNPVDGSVWTSYSMIPGGMARLDPKTGLYEYYQVPYMNPSAKVEGYLPHGIDVDSSTGVMWLALNSGHFAEFDRRKCKGPLNGPGSETGLHCVEGWTLHQMPGPNFKGVETSGTSDNYYLNWVDWYGASGLGTNVPMANGSGSDALYAYVDGKFVTLRVPYPMGFHTRGMDGRIDDPNAGWKGRGIWTTHAGQAAWHQEGGKSERPKVIHFQVRPNPLAK
jgi:hypothetical protein